MAFDKNTISFYHGFSKTPAAPGTTLGNAINKSGHTVSATEVWTDDIPYFGKMPNTATIHAKVSPYARKNDLCFTTGDSKIWKKNDVVYTEGSSFNDLWTEVTDFADGYALYNAEDKHVLTYHAAKTLTNLTGDNNANTDSQDNSARLWLNGRLIEQFVAPTDKALNGLASVYYSPAIKQGTTDLVEGTDYNAVNFSGTILWASASTATRTISCFEYVGDKVSDSVSTIQTDIAAINEALGLGGEADGSIGERLTDVEDKVSTLESTTTTQGTSIAGLTTRVESLEKIEHITASDIATAKNEAITAASQDAAAKVSTLSSTVVNSTDSDADNNVTVTLGGTVGNPTVTVSSTGLATAAALKTLSDKVDSYHTTPQFKVEVVTDLPASPTENTIYLVGPDEESADGSYVEWIAYKSGESVVTEKIGSTKVDLSGYATVAALTAVSEVVADNTTAISTLQTDVQTAQNTADAAQDAADAVAERVSTLEAKEDKTVDIVATTNSEDGTYTNYVSVTKGATANGVTTYTVGSTAALEERLDTLDRFISGSDGEGISELLAKKVDNVTGGNNGITISTADTEDGRVATLNVAVSTTVEDSTNLVTSKAVQSAIVTTENKIATALNEAKAYTDDALNGKDATVSDTTGSVTVTQTDGLISGVSISGGAISETETKFVTGSTIHTTTSAIEQSLSDVKDTADAAKATADTAVQSASGDTYVTLTKTDTAITATTNISAIDSALVADGTSVKTAITDAKTAAQNAQTTANSKVSQSDYDTKIGELEEAISNAAPANYVTSINGSEGAKAFTIKDGRETVYPNDLWGTTVNVADGVITVQGGPIDGSAWGPKNGYNTKGSVWSNGTNYPQGTNPITKVENNMVYNGTTEVANIKTDELVNGNQMFKNTSLTSFSGDLSSLVNGANMFNNCTSLTSFSGDLSSLDNGANMFDNCTSLTSFSGDLSSLVNGANMFYQCTSLDVESVELICDVLPNYNTENGGKQLQTATWNTDGENKGKYTYSDWTSGDYYYPIIIISEDYGLMSQGNVDDINRSFGTRSISESDVKSITITWGDISVLSEADRTAITKLFTDTATEKGWTFITNTELGGTVSPNAVMAADGTIQYYVLAKKDGATEDDATHIDASGKLWKLDTAEAIIGPNIKYWSMFATVEDALTEWELTPWTKPTE